jgi:predicted Zn-dependent peptidase
MAPPILWNKEINGMKMSFVPMKHVDTVAVGIFVRVGSRYENEKNSGISHLIEHMMFKGTKEKKGDDISLMLDKEGASYNAGTSNEFTYYFICGHKKSVYVFIELIFDMIFNPAFRLSDLKTERNVVIEEIKLGKDSPNQVLMNYIQEKMFDGSSLARTITGPASVVGKITPEQLKQYTNEFYNPKRMVFMAVGNMNPKKIYRLLKSYVPKIIQKRNNTTTLYKVPSFKQQKNPMVYIKKKEDIGQTYIALIFRSCHQFHKDEEVYDLIGDVLSTGSSSRLFMLLRNKLGIAYFVNSFNLAFCEEGIFCINAGVDNKRVGQAIEEIVKTIVDLKNNGITEDEYTKITKLQVASFALSLQTPEDYMKFYGLRLLFKDIDYPKPTKIVKKISVEDQIKIYENIPRKKINSTINDLFSTDNVNLFVYGTSPSKNIGKTLNLLKKKSNRK